MYHYYIRSIRILWDSQIQKATPQSLDKLLIPATSVTTWDATRTDEDRAWKACDMESLWKRKFTSFLNHGLWLSSSRSTVDILIDIHSWLMCFLFGKIFGVFLHSSHQLKNSAKTLAESINLSHGGERVAAVNIPCWIKKAGWYPSNILPWLKTVLRLAVTASWFPGHLAPFQSSIHPISSFASGRKARTLQHWISIKFWILINQWHNYLIRYLPSQLGQKENPWVQAMLSTTKKWAKQNTIHQINHQ